MLRSLRYDGSKAGRLFTKSPSSPANYSIEAVWQSVAQSKKKLCNEYSEELQPYEVLEIPNSKTVAVNSAPKVCLRFRNADNTRPAKRSSVFGRPVLIW